MLISPTTLRIQHIITFIEDEEITRPPRLKAKQMPSRSKDPPEADKSSNIWDYGISRPGPRRALNRETLSEPLIITIPY